LDALAQMWGVQVHQTQEMKGKEGMGDLGGPDTKSGQYCSGSSLCPSREKKSSPDTVGKHSEVEPCELKLVL